MTPRTARDLMLDGAVLALAAGAAINLSFGQLALVVAGVLLVERALRRDADLIRAWSELGPAIVAPLFFLFACVLATSMTRAPWPGLFEATRFRPLLALPVVALAIAVRGGVLARRAAVVFAIGCAVHALVGFYQMATGEAPLAELLQVPLERRVVPAPGNEALRSAVGLFYNRVRLSHVLAGGVAAAMGLALLGTARRWMLVPAVVTLAGLVGTFGRAAWMALVVTLAASAAIAVVFADRSARRKRFLVAAGSLALVVGMVVAVPPARARLASAVDLSRNADRLFLWGRGVEIASDHAPYGTGFGGYSVVRDAYYDRVDDSVQSRAMSHSQLLSLLAETGFLGLLGWLWLWWVLYARAFRTRDPVALTGAMVAATFHAATFAHDPLYQSECALAWGFGGALMVCGGFGNREGRAIAPAT